MKEEDWKLHLIKCSSDYLLASTGWGWVCHNTHIPFPDVRPHLLGDHQQGTRLQVTGGALCCSVRDALSVPCCHGRAHIQQELVWSRAAAKGYLPLWAFSQFCVSPFPSEQWIFPWLLVAGVSQQLITVVVRSCWGISYGEEFLNEGCSCSQVLLWASSDMLGISMAFPHISAQEELSLVFLCTKWVC